MDNEVRKAEIRRRLTLARYPRRSAARFTDENDHNPAVMQDCPCCRGWGTVCEYFSTEDISGYSRVECPDCGGSGVTGEIEPYFTNETPEAEATADAEGWLTCPGCRWRFTVRDRNAWTGRRHLRCGQKIGVVFDGAGTLPTARQPGGL